MAKAHVTPVNEELSFGQDEIIVSKTDLTGRLLYVNDVFCRVAEMTTQELIGQPHSVIRHPDMPRAGFQLLWDSIQKGQEIFVYVKNMSKTGRFYWVIAHVTPTIDKHGAVTGYHSNRRKPSRDGIAAIEPIYARLKAEEKRHANRKQGLKSSMELFNNILSDAGMNYDQFVWSLESR